LLRDARESHDEDVTVTISAADPANPYGVLIPWPLQVEEPDTKPKVKARGATRSAGARVILVNGRLVCWIGRGDRQLIVSLPDDEPERSRAGHAMARELVALAHRAPEGRRGWLIEEINGQPAADDPAGRFLIAAGFAATHNGLQFRIGKGIKPQRPSPQPGPQALEPSSPPASAEASTFAEATRTIRRARRIKRMPEGDSIYRAARSLNKVLAGHVVTKFDTAYAHLSRVDDDTPIAGRTVERCESAGKHLLIVFSGDLILRTHMRMNGSWHLYRHGERWWRGPQAMRVRIDTADWVAVAFDVPVAEFVTARQLQATGPVGRARTRPAGAAFDRDEAVRRIVISGRCRSRRRCWISGW
jgi:hypothetical protein